MSENEKPALTEAVQETPEMLAEQITGLQAKLQQAELAAAEEEKVEEIEMAEADMMVTVAKGHEVPRQNVTAAECALLVGQFHKEAGGVPVKNITNIRIIRRDPRAEKARLCRRYGVKKVEALFPGAEPKLPLTFRRALGIGASVIVKAESLGDFVVKPENTGEE